MKSNFIPSSIAHYSTDTEILNKRNRELRSLLEHQPDSLPPDSAERKAGILYRKCMNEDAMEDTGIFAINTIIQTTGDWAVSGTYILQLAGVSFASIFTSALFHNTKFKTDGQKQLRSNLFI